MLKLTEKVLKCCLKSGRQLEKLLDLLVTEGDSWTKPEQSKSMRSLCQPSLLKMWGRELRRARWKHLGSFRQSAKLGACTTLWPDGFHPSVLKECKVEITLNGRIRCINELYKKITVSECKSHLKNGSQGDDNSSLVYKRIRCGRHKQQHDKEAEQPKD